MTQRGDGAALRLGDIGVERGEARDIQFVDQPAALEPGRSGRHLRQRPCHDGARDKVSGILAILRKARVLDEGNDWFQASNLEITDLAVGNPATNLIPAQARARQTGLSLYVYLFQLE